MNSGLRFAILALAGSSLLLSCSRSSDKEGQKSSRPPARVSLVKLMSWAEPGQGGTCETDLQGHAPPARYTLRYSEDGHDPIVIETDAEKLSRAGWQAINRSERGMGFEKVGEYTSIDFDIWEELQCSCDTDATDPAKGWKRGIPVNVKIVWKANSVPVVTAAILGDDGKPQPVKGVTMDGQFATYEFRFSHPFPEGHPGECTSRFFAGLELSEPI